MKAQRRNQAQNTTLLLLCGAILSAAVFAPGCRPVREVASGQAHLTKAALYLRFGRPLFARAEYALTRAEQPANARLLTRFGALFTAYGRWKDAAGAYEDSLVAKPDPDTAVLLAEIYWSAPGYGMDRYADPIEGSLRLAASIDPNHPGTLNSLAYFYAERGERLSEALALSRRSIRLSPTTPAYLDTLGWIHYKLGEPGRALPFLEQAVELDWFNAELREHLAACFERLGDRKRAQLERAKARLLSGRPAAPPALHPRRGTPSKETQPPRILRT